ncbi:MAG: DUF4190 domain-containing protein [Bacteroidetes bacterium]|jgi:hypothetical protein|nr:DUF4190 domain-containing protein [Bacteroidota bacterium]
MEETTTTTNSKAGKGLGIAGLVLGILAAVVSFVPCLGMYAIFPGIIGLVLSIISIVQANKAGAAKGMAIAGLVCSLVGTSIAAWQYYAINKIATEAAPGLENLKDALENLDTAKLRQEMEAAVQQVADSLQQH